MQNLVELNKQFSLSDQLYFEQGEEGFVMINISNQYADARISSYGGQVVSYLAKDQLEDLLFLSDKTVYQHGKAIRGGIPVCWPWFGDDTSGFGRPSHGFARNQQWNVVASDALLDGRTSITLGLQDTEESRTVWPYEFELELEVIVGTSLDLKLTTKNMGAKAFTISQALHTYFNISDVTNIAVEGLDEKTYLDKLDGFNAHKQSGDVVFTQEIDRVYCQSPESVLLTDTGFNRKIMIASSGSETTVVWNPWATAIKNIADLDELSYQQFVCVETANAAADVVTVPAGSSHAITASYTIN